MALAIQPHRGQIATASGLDVLAGIWLLISPFVLRFSLTTPTSNNVILGIIIGILALIRFAGGFDLVALSWINVLLGIWVLISPWVLQFTTAQTPTTNNVITGIVVILLAGWSALATATTTTSATDQSNLPPTT